MGCKSPSQKGSLSLKRTNKWAVLIDHHFPFFLDAPFDQVRSLM
jgi:hypothetical protein